MVFYLLFVCLSLVLLPHRSHCVAACAALRRAAPLGLISQSHRRPAAVNVPRGGSEVGFYMILFSVKFYTLLIIADIYAEGRFYLPDSQCVTPHITGVLLNLSSCF